MFWTCTCSSTPVTPLSGAKGDKDCDDCLGIFNCTCLTCCYGCLTYHRWAKCVLPMWGFASEAYYDGCTAWELVLTYNPWTVKTGEEDVHATSSLHSRHPSIHSRPTTFWRWKLPSNTITSCSWKILLCLLNWCSFQHLKHVCFFPLPGLGSTTGYSGCGIPKIVIVIMFLLYFQKITWGDKSHTPKILRLNTPWKQW